MTIMDESTAGVGGVEIRGRSCLACMEGAGPGLNPS